MTVIIRKFRYIPARPPQPMRRLVVVDFQRNKATKEVGLDFSSHSFRTLPTAAAVATACAPIWRRCVHGVVLVAGGDDSTPFGGLSQKRCHSKCCVQQSQEWFNKFSTTIAWRIEHGGGSYSVVL